jgi:hypothetical protein
MPIAISLYHTFANFRFPFWKTWKRREKVQYLSQCMRYINNNSQWHPIFIMSANAKHPMPSQLTTPFVSIFGSHAGRHGQNGKVQYIGRRDSSKFFAFVDIKSYWMKMRIVALPHTLADILHFSKSFPCLPAWRPEMENDGVVTMDGSG